MNIGSYYRPPRADQQYLDLLEESLGNIFRKSGKHPNIILTGDFNLSDINWEANTVDGRTDPGNAQCLLDITNQMGLQQHQLDITRRASNNILDLVYSSNPNLVTHISTVPGMSDHDAVLTSRHEAQIQPKTFPQSQFCRIED